MTENYQIDYNLIQEILSNAENICRKRAHKTHSKDYSVDLLTILHSYTEVLRDKEIDTSKDAGYYKFILDLSVENNKLREPDWFACFEKIRRKYERKRLVFLHYCKKLCIKAFIGLRQNVLLRNQDKSQDLDSLPSTLQQQTLRSFIRAATKDQSSVRSRNTHNQTMPAFRNNRGYFEFNGQNMKENIPMNSPTMEDIIGHEKENSPKSETLSFIDDYSQRAIRPSVPQQKRVDPIDIITALNRSAEKMMTPYLGRTSNRTDDKPTAPQSVEMQTAQRVSRTTDTTMRFMTKDSSQLKTILREVNRYDSRPAERKIADMSRRGPVLKDEEALKIMNSMFVKWCIYVQKRKDTRQEKDRMIKKTLSAMEHNYHTLLTKGFVSLGLYHVNKKRIRDNYLIIKEKYEYKVKRHTFTRYRIAYDKHLIKNLLKSKADKFNDKKILKRQLIKWKQTTKENKKRVKAFRMVWQPKILLYLLSGAYGISLGDPNHEILDSLAKRLYVPPSKEEKVLEAITMLNEDILAKSFAFWKAYSQKCLESKDFHNQRIASKVFIFWKHYSTKNKRIRLNEDNLCLKKDTLLKIKTLKKWKSIARKTAYLKQKGQLISKKVTTRTKRKHFQHWISLFDNLVYERDMDNFSSNFHNKRLKQKCFNVLCSRVGTQLQTRFKKLNALTLRTEQVAQKFFSQWHKFAVKQRTLRNREEQLTDEKHLKCMRAYLEEWRFSYSASQKINAFRHRNLKIKFFEELQKIIEYNNEIMNRAERYHAKIENKYYKKTVKKVFNALKWRIRLDRLHEEFQQGQSVRLAKSYFGLWRKRFSKEKDIRERVDETLYAQRSKDLQAVFDAWRNYTEKRKTLHSLSKEPLAEVKNKILNKFYWQWREALEAKRELQNRKIMYNEKALEFYQNKQLSHVFDTWREEYFISTTRRYLTERNNLRIMREAFDVLYVGLVTVRKGKLLALLGEKYGNQKVMKIHFDQWKTITRDEDYSFELFMRNEGRENKLEAYRQNLEQKLLGTAFKGWQNFVAKKIRLRKMEEELVAFNKYKSQHFYFKALKQNMLGAQDEDGKGDQHEMVLKEVIFTSWKNFTGMKINERLKVGYLEAKKQKRTLQTFFSRIWEEHMMRRISKQISERFGRNDEETLLRTSFEAWKQFLDEQAMKKFRIRKANEIYGHNLKKRALIALALVRTKRNISNYQNSLAVDHFMGVAFKKFLRGIFIKMERRDGKVQAIKYYAKTLLLKSIYQWKTYTEEKISHRYHKIMEPIAREQPRTSYTYQEEHTDPSNEIDAPFSDNNRKDSRDGYI